MDTESVLEIVSGIKLKGSLLSHTVQHTIVDFISDRIKSAVPELASLHKSIELLKTVCNCVENSGLNKKKHKTIDKKQLVIAIYRKLYPQISDKDIADLSAQIEDLINNGLIKKIPYSKRVFRDLGLLSRKKRINQVIKMVCIEHAGKLPTEHHHHFFDQRTWTW